MFFNELWLLEWDHEADFTSSVICVVLYYQCQYSKRNNKKKQNLLFLQVVQWALEDQEDPTKKETNAAEMSMCRYSNNEHAQILKPKLDNWSSVEL